MTIGSDKFIIGRMRLYFKTVFLISEIGFINVFVDNNYIMF